MKKFLYLLITLSLIVFGCAKANDPYQEEHKMKVIHSFTTQGDPIQVDTSEDMLFIADDYAGYHIYNLNSGALIKSANSYLYAGVPAPIQAKLIYYHKYTNTMFLLNRLLLGANWNLEVYSLDNLPSQTFLTYSSGDTVDLTNIVFTPSDTTTANSYCYRGVRKENKIKFSHVSFDTQLLHDKKEVQTNPQPQRIEVADNHIFTAYGQVGITISEKETLAEVNSFDTPGYAMDVKVKDNYAYIADKQAGFHVYKLDDAMNATKVYTYDTEGYAENVAVRGNYAAVSSTSGGVYLFDISNPDNPKMIDRLPMSQIGYVNNVHFSQYGNEKILYVVSREKGVLKIQID
ncbi:MAG: hypothetical protein KA886_06250 [Candidatus Cloacimonetes bacterium]|nr:hypothetical protein [Candidatus Cloacimonadota bacterium]